MPQFRRKPVIIEAFQLPPESEAPTQELLDFLDKTDYESDYGGGLILHNQGIILRGDPEDWVIQKRGVFDILRPEIFEGLYEPVEE